MSVRGAHTNAQLARVARVPIIMSGSHKDPVLFPLNTKLKIKWRNAWHESEVISVYEEMVGPNTYRAQHHIQYSQAMQQDEKGEPQSLIWQNLDEVGYKVLFRPTLQVPGVDEK